MTIMDSMNDDELDMKVKLTNSRCYRIALGSGTSMEDIEILCTEHKRLASVVTKLGKANLGKEGDLA